MRPRFQPPQREDTFAVIVLSLSEWSVARRVRCPLHGGSLAQWAQVSWLCSHVTCTASTAACSPGKISTCIGCHIDTAGRVLLRQYFRLVSLVASLRLRAGNSFRGQRGVEGGRGFHEVCQLLSDTCECVCMRVCVCTSSDYAERICGSLLKETPHKALQLTGRNVHFCPDV